ncbi:MAG TPA: hypothetical protein VHT91_25470 [Kofleriaceae bacterium]|nr:hypothetical protein [Kofleriaceae bacterium]
MIKRLGGGTSLVMAGLAMSACATDRGPTDPAADAPIAEVDLANGSRVMFFEPVPGTLAIGEQTAIGVAQVDTTGKSPVEVYRSIAPGQPVPAALAEAQARADAAHADRPARALPAQPAAVAGPQSESFSSSWFADNFCYNESYAFINCHLGVNDTGVKVDLSGTHTDVDEFKASLCVNSGKVTLRTWVDGDPHVAAQVTDGNCWTWHLWNGGDDTISDSTTIDSASANYFFAAKWNL